MLLWAQVTKNVKMLAQAAYMYASETDVARRYEMGEDAVTDPSGNQFALISNTFCQLYDDSNQLALFFAQCPGNLFAREAQHAINWLPFGGGSLYLTVNATYAGMNYQGMVNQPPGSNPYPNPITPPYGDDWKFYIDLIWMYRSIINPGEPKPRWRRCFFQMGGYPTTPTAAGEFPG
jgi:endoglucanase Acf2